MPLVLVTVWRMLVSRAHIQAGDFVLVWGASGGSRRDGDSDREALQRASDRGRLQR